MYASSNTKWLKEWNEVYGFPSNYVTFDLETTGLIKDQDLITEIGFSFVAKGRETQRQLLVLDWTQEPSIDQFWLKLRLAATAAQMQCAERTYHITYDRLQSHVSSVAPTEGLQMAHDILLQSRNRGDFLVGHNVWRFDTPFLEKHFARFLGTKTQFYDNEIVDTGDIEKGQQLGLYPWAGQTLFDFHNRVESIRGKGVKWSLSEHCVPRYKLDKLYRLDLTKAHVADYDAYMTHLLFEHYKNAGTNNEDSIYTATHRKNQSSMCGGKPAIKSAT